jgi:NADH-quinone oxidoreductase subunit M
VTAAATYLLVVWGAVVRVTNSGLGCPDWPLCYGGVLPPLDDPQAWIEWIHRTWAAVVGLLVLAVVVVAGMRYRRRSVVVPAVLALVFTGFAVLAGMFPFHTWAPTGHVAAPTAASMLLAGVVMKLGAYGCLRVAMPLFPVGLAFWQPTIAALAIIGILYAGFIALVQDDFKFAIGYSSVSHMGFVLLGLAAANSTAVAGAVLQMFSHGVIAGLLFAVVGRMVYERTHTRKLADLRQLPLYRMLPFAALTFVLAGLASMGMPGFSGFPAELTILIGTWKTSHVWAIFAGAGILVAAAFTLRAIHVSFFGSTAPISSLPSSDSHHEYEPITLAEKAGAALLLAATVYIGLKPDVLLDWITPALQSPLMQAALKGGSL